MDDRPLRLDDDRQRFSHVPFPLIHAMRDGLVSFTAVALYAALDQYRDRQTARAWPGIRSLAKDVGLSRSNVHRQLHELERAGFIAVERPANPSKPVVYTLRYAPPPRTTARGGGRPTSGTRPGRVPPNRGVSDLTPPSVERRVPIPLTTGSISSEFQGNQPATRGAPVSDPDPDRTARFSRLLERRRRP